MSAKPAPFSWSDGSDPTAPLESRLRYCIAMLHIHGAVTDAERFKIGRRLLKTADAATKKAKGAK